MFRPGFSAVRLLAVAGALLSASGHAHHEPGHTPSESLRNLTSLGGDPNPRQRVALLTQAARGTNEPTLNTATVYSISALADIRLHRRLYIGGQFPLVLADEDSTSEPKLGYGDTILGVNMPLGSLQTDAASWVAGLNVSLPTRTIRYQSDPGKQWLVAPGLRYGDAWGPLLWYGIFVIPVETRPAGTAVDLSPAFGLGYRLFRAMTITAGVNADIRTFTVCKTFDGSEICTDGRVTESNRHTGSTRVYAHAALSADIHRNWSVFLGGQLPLSALRDVEWAVNLGVEARF